MAKPDCENGWIKLAHELFAAIACAGFNKWESVVIRETLHQIYGPAKKREATLSPTDIASRAGTFKESIVRAIRSLKASGVILETARGVRFVKDYERWTWAGEPRLNPVEVRYCKDARPSNASTEDGNESVPHASSEPGNESVPISTNVGNESVPLRERIGSPAGTKALPAGNGSVPRAHKIERAGLRIGEREKGREKSPPPISPSAPSPEIEAVVAMSERRWNVLLEPGTFTRDLCYDYEPSWVKRALNETYDVFGPNELPRPWVRKKLQAWWAEGRPPDRKPNSVAKGGETPYRSKPVETKNSPKIAPGPPIPAAIGMRLLKGEITAEEAEALAAKELPREQA